MSVKVDPSHNGAPLFTLPPILPDLKFGVLRREYSGRENSAVAHVWTKLNPVTAERKQGGHHTLPWTMTASRSDVLLPPTADDRLMAPAALMRSFEDALPVGQKDLLVSIKITLTDDAAMHGQWERVRAFARGFLTSQSLAVVMVLHDPTKTGSRAANCPHIHLLAPATRLGPGGWRGITDLARDEAHPAIAEAWKEAKLE